MSYETHSEPPLGFLPDRLWWHGDCRSAENHDPGLVRRRDHLPLKPETFDFHAVRDGHIAIHDALLNWARVVRVHVTSGGNCGPIFKHYRTSSYSFDKNEAKWVDDEPRKPPPDMQAGWRMERRMRNLPEKYRLSLKWHYIEPFKPPAKVAHKLAVTLTVLFQMVHDARSMLKNRSH